MAQTTKTAPAESKPKKEKELLSINEVLDLLDISRSQFLRIRKKGNFPKPAVQDPMRWRKSDIVK